MTKVVGTLKNSGGEAVTGELEVTLDSALIDASTSPDSVHLPQTKVFTITNGALALNLAQSETSNLTYHFLFNTFDTEIEFYFQNGDLYIGPTHRHTDNLYYTGDTHTPDSQLLSRVETQNPIPIFDFRAIVPNVAEVEFSALLPTGITTDVLDSSIRRLASLLTSNTDYVEALRGGPKFKGNYSSTTYYQKDDAVAYNGASWIYLADEPAAGITPIDTSTYWQKIAAKGDSGGTGGNDTAYDAASWDGQTDAPSRNALRDIIQQLARVSQLADYAPLNSPNFSGTPTAENPLASDRTTRIATTRWVGDSFASFDSPAFTGNPTVQTPDVASNSGRIASTAYVKTNLANYALLESPIFSGNPTVPNPPLTDNDTSIANTFFVRQQILSTSNADAGWQKIAPNILIQWGSTAANTDASGNLTVSYPINFTSVITVNVTNGDPQVWNGYLSVYNVFKTTNTGFSVSTANPSRVSSPIRVNWIAFGNY